MTNKIFSLAIAATFSLTVLIAKAEDKDKIDVSKLPPASDKKDLTYEKDVKPLFEHSCFKCHGTEKQKGKLRLDSIEAVMKGGEDGEVVKKGNGTDSPMVHAISRLTEDSAMPPGEKGKPLSKEEVGIVRAWIDQGAK